MLIFRHFDLFDASGAEIGIGELKYLFKQKFLRRLHFKQKLYKTPVK